MLSNVGILRIFLDVLPFPQHSCGAINRAVVVRGDVHPYFNRSSGIGNVICTALAKYEGQSNENRTPATK